MNRGLIRFQRDQLSEAAADYLAAIRIKKDPNAHANLAFLYQKQGKTNEAIAEFSEAIALEPDWAALYRGRADMLVDRPDATPKDRAAAQVDLKLAIRYEDRDSTVLARDHTSLGKLYYADEQFDDALEETKRALQYVSDDYDASVLQFPTLLQLRKFDEVIHACDIALANGRKSAVIYEFRGLRGARTKTIPAQSATSARPWKFALMTPRCSRNAAGRT